MGLSAEFQRNIEAAIAAKDDVAKETLESHKRAIEADEAAGKFQQLPVKPILLPSVQLTDAPAVETAQTAPADSPTPEQRLSAQVTKLTAVTFRDQLMEELKSRGQEIVLPEPSAEIVEVYNILAGEGYEVAPIAFVDGKRKEVRMGVFETVTRPDYTDGSQMYYSPRPDPAAGILRRGRTENPQRIVFPYGNASEETRFYVSWNEIHNYVVPEAIKTTPHLAQQLTKGGITLDIPDLADFRAAGQTHNLEAYSWEWVQNSARFGHRCIAGRRARGVLVWPPDSHGGHVGFRFEAVSRPQKLPR